MLWFSEVVETRISMTAAPHGRRGCTGGSHGYGYGWEFSSSCFSCFGMIGKGTLVSSLFAAEITTVVIACPLTRIVRAATCDECLICSHFLCSIEAYCFERRQRLGRSKHGLACQPICATQCFQASLPYNIIAAAHLPVQ